MLQEMLERFLWSFLMHASWSQNTQCHWSIPVFILKVPCLSRSTSCEATVTKLHVNELGMTVTWRVSSNRQPHLFSLSSILRLIFSLYRHLSLWVKYASTHMLWLCVCTCALVLCAVVTLQSSVLPCLCAPAIANNNIGNKCRACSQQPKNWTLKINTRGRLVESCLPC